MARAEGKTTVDAYIGDYQVIRKIAEGSVGEVFEGIDPTRQRRAAIKCLRPELAKRAELLQRFDSEAQTLALLVHPNIARVLSFIRQGDRLYLALEFVEGETLQAILKRSGRIEPALALSFFHQILRAVGFAHRIGVIHGDLKPANIMVTHSGAVRVMDFGIAHIFGRPKRTRAGYLVGTVQYMSPEQIRGEPLDARSDIYSLGILLYELIAGHVPFDSDSDEETIRAQSDAIPVPPSLLVADSPEWLDAVLRRALAKSRSNRFQSVTEMAHAIGFRVEGDDRIVWTEQPALLVERTRQLALLLQISVVRAISPRRWISSVSHPILRTADIALGSTKERLVAAAKICRTRYASGVHVIRLGIEATNPRVWAKRSVIRVQRAGRSLSLSLLSFLLLISTRALAPLRSILASAAAAGSKLAYGAGLALATARRNVRVATTQATVQLQRTGVRIFSASNSVSASTNRVLGSSRTASGTSWKRTALLASLLIALSAVALFFEGDERVFSPVQKPASKNSLNDSVDQMLAQANRRAITASPPAIKPEPQAKGGRPMDKRPAIADKPLRSRQRAKSQPEPAKTNTVELSQVPSAGAGSNKPTDQPAVKEPRSREPAPLERKAENKARTPSLNVRWEN
ncbi:MAG: serine/threonine-protein kinase [Candidatus Binatia bacterium]